MAKNLKLIQRKNIAIDAHMGTAITEFLSARKPLLSNPTRENVEAAGKLRAQIAAKHGYDLDTFISAVARNISKTW